MARPNLGMTNINEDDKSRFSKFLKTFDKMQQQTIDKYIYLLKKIPQEYLDKLSNSQNNIEAIRNTNELILFFQMNSNESYNYMRNIRYLGFAIKKYLDSELSFIAKKAFTESIQQISLQKKDKGNHVKHVTQEEFNMLLDACKYRWSYRGNIKDKTSIIEVDGNSRQILVKRTGYDYHFWQLLLETLFGSGLRISEALQLVFDNFYIAKIDAFDENKKKIQIEVPKIMIDGIGKGGKKGERYLTREAYDKIMQYKETYNKNGNDLVFDVELKYDKNILSTMDSKAKKLYILKRKRVFVEAEFTRIAKSATHFNKRKNFSPHALRHCIIDDDIEILTVNGWKKRVEVKRGTKIYNYDINNDCIVEDKILKMNVHNYDGELYHLKNRYFDYMITPEHNIVCRYSVEKQKNINKKKFRTDKWNDWHLETIQNLNESISKRTLHHKIASKKINGKSIGLERAGILGWLLTDGGIYKTKKRCAQKGYYEGKYECYIRQSYTTNLKKCKIIEDLLKNSGLEFSIKKQPIKNSTLGKCGIMQYRILQSNINWIFKWINPDRTPKWKLLELPYEELDIMYKMMMMGDGHKKEFTNQKKPIIDFIRVLGIMTGRRSILSKGEYIGNLNSKQRKQGWKWRTHFSTPDYCQLEIEKCRSKNKHLTMKQYKGKVWCPTTNNGTVIIKSNEKIFITGNSLGMILYKKGMPLDQIQNVLDHSDISTTQIYAKASDGEIATKFNNLMGEKDE